MTAQLFRAALEGTAPSLALLHPMLNRLRVDMARDGSTALLNHSRFALAKLILNRNRKENTMEVTEQQDAKAEDTAYQCGRLLAVLAEAQAKAHDYQLKGAGVAGALFWHCYGLASLGVPSPPQAQPPPSQQYPQVR